MGIIAFILIFIFIFIFAYFSFRLYESVLNLPEGDEISGGPIPLSVIVSLRNESSNIPALIENLSALNYPKDKLEIILIDDNSTDNSFKLIKDLTESNPVFKVCKADGKLLPGKKGALTVGVSKATRGNIMITDADCRPSPDWLLHASAKFSEGFDMIFGSAPFYKNSGAAANISCFENLRNFVLGFGMAGMGLPYTAAARNFGFTKKAFEKVHGYANTAETLSGDDDLLIREAVKKNLKIGVMISEGSRVYSAAKQNIGEYFSQRARHTKTSFHYLPKIRFLLGLWHLTNIVLTFSFLSAFLNPFLIIPFLIKIFIDLLIIKNLQGIFGYKFNIPEILALQLNYEMFLIINFVNAAFRKDRWK